ncbi:unnamed protein product, partial [Sphacelaria rigidula]
VSTQYSDDEDDFSTPHQPATNPRKRSAKEYCPRYKTGAFAILAALLLFEQEDGSFDADKDSIVSIAQPFSTDAMIPPSIARDHKDRYGSWSGITTLEDHHLVTRNKSVGRHRFALTEAGRQLALRLKQDHGIARGGICHPKKKGCAAAASASESSG